MTKFLVPIALVIVVGIVQMESAFYALNVGVISRWGLPILFVGMLFNAAIIVHSVAVRRTQG